MRHTYDHPEITRTQLSGYPFPRTPPLAVCEGCREEQLEGDALYCWENLWLCCHCLCDAVADLSAEQLADLLELEYKIVTQVEDTEL